MTRSHSFRLLAAGIAALIAFSVSAKEPKQPVKVCIENTPDCGTTPDRAPSNGIKWHPGHYVYLDDPLSVDNLPQRRELHTRQIEALDADPEIKGIKIHIYWAVLEGPAAGDYSQGFRVLDWYLQKLGALKVPRRLMLVINERAFGTYNETRMDAVKAILPEYIVTTPEYGYAFGEGSGGLGLAARIWERPTMDRLIALSQALAKRYDDNPLFEMIGFQETTFGLPGSGFDLAAYHAQLERWFEASGKAWRHTQLRLNANFGGGGSDAKMQYLIERTTKWGDVAVGGPDPEIAPRRIQANQVFRGETGGGKDLRGVVAWVGEQMGAGLGRKQYPTRTPAELFDYQYSTMRANYMIWQRNEHLGGDEQKWSTGILPFIRSINGKIHTECPQTYKNRCRSN